MKQLIKQSKLGITEENVSTILSQTCLLTNLKIKGKKGGLSLEKYLSINAVPSAIQQGKAYADMTDTEKREVEAYKVGKKIRTTMSYIPKDVLTKIDTKQSKLRHEYYDACVASNMMTTKAFEEFKANKIDATCKEIDDILADVELNWDTIISNFRSDILVKYPHLKETQVDKLIASLGNGKDFRDSYAISLEYTPIPNNYSVQGMAVEYQQEAERKVNEDAANELANVIGMALNSAFQGLNRVLISNKSLRNLNSKVAIGAKTKASMINAGLELEAKVGFLKIDNLDNLVKRIQEVTEIKDDTELVEQTEVCLSEIYTFMVNNDLREYLDLTDSVMSEELLEVYC